jgi:hypothetical protein
MRMLLTLLLALPAQAQSLAEIVDQQVAAGAPRLHRIGDYYQAVATRKGDRSDWYLPLEAGRCYWLGGAGGGEVRELFLYVWDPDNRRLADNRPKSSTVTLAFCAAKSGMHHVQAKVARGAGPYLVGAYSNVPSQKAAAASPPRRAAAAPPPSASQAVTTAQSVFGALSSISVSSTTTSTTSSSSSSSSGSDEGEERCGGEWTLGSSAVVNSRNPMGTECNDYYAPTNCPTGLYIQFPKKGKCYCMVRCSELVNAPAPSQNCTPDGSWVCQDYHSTISRNHATFCAPAEWNLCH